MSSPKQNLKITHISDVHIGYLGPRINEIYPHKDFYEKLNEELRKKILEKVQKFEPDLILFTGDLVDHNGYKSVEAKECATNFVKKLTNENSIKHYFSPGNHDVTYTKPKSETVPQDREILTIEKIKEEISQIKKQASTRVSFSSYQTLFTPPKGEFNDDLFDLYRFNMKDINIAVININNSWFCRRGDDTNKLYIDSDRAKEIINELENNPPDLVLGMTHHPESYNNYRENYPYCVCAISPTCSNFEVCKNRTEKGYCQSFGSFNEIANWCDIIFSGHTHLQNIYFENTNRIAINKYLDSPCGALYFNIGSWYTSAQFNCLDIPIENFAPALSQTSVDSEKMYLHELIGEESQIDVNKLVNYNEDDLFYKSILINKIQKFQPDLIPKIVPFPDVAEIENLGFNDIVTKTYVYRNTTYTPDDLKSNTINLKVEDFIQTQTCIVERYFSEVFIAEQDSLSEKISFYKKISGTKFFMKLATFLSEKYEDFDFLNEHDKKGEEVLINVINFSSNHKTNIVLYYKEFKKRIVIPFLKDFYVITGVELKLKDII